MEMKIYSTQPVSEVFARVHAAAAAVAAAFEILSGR